MKLAILALLLSGCSYTPQLDVIGGYRRVGGDNVPGACAVVSQKLTERQKVYYLHCSDPTNGRPFNRDFDISDDVIGYGMSFGGKKRDPR